MFMEKRKGKEKEVGIGLNVIEIEDWKCKKKKMIGGFRLKIRKFM